LNGAVATYRNEKITRIEYNLTLRMQFFLGNAFFIHRIKAKKNGKTKDNKSSKFWSRARSFLIDQAVLDGKETTEVKLIDYSEL